MSAQDPTTSGIYAIRCLVNGKVYIGSAVSFRARWKRHRNDLKNGSHDNRHLQNACDKHGFDQFAFEILQLVPEKTDLIRVEQEWLDRIRPFDNEVGYNLSPTAGSTLGVKGSPEFKAKMAALKTGTKHTPEELAKMSESAKAFAQTPEGKAMSAEFAKRAHTPEARAKRGDAFRGRKKGPLSPEQKAKISASSTGHKKSPEARARMSASLRKRQYSAETRAKMSASAKARRCRRKPAPHQKKFPWMD